MLDRAGRLQIPAEVLEKIGMQKKKRMILETQDGKLVLRPPDADGED